MRIERLRLANFRNIRTADIEPAERLSYFVGPNGAGKTSLIEAAYLLSHGDSFRTAQNNVLANRDGGVLAVHADIGRQTGSMRLDMALLDNRLEARVNGNAVPSLAGALAEFALVCFEPGSHALISGASSGRRRFLDWILFHVEHSYLDAARTFRRVLAQRNALLRRGAPPLELEPWDAAFLSAAVALTRLRESLFPRYAIELSKILSIFLPELGAVQVSFRRGWSEGEELSVVLAASRNQDIQRGHSTRGPHRADWSIRFEKAPAKEQLSRGQEKLCALACVLTQAQLFAESKGEWPVIALDDFSSELDQSHQHAAMAWLAATPAQLLISTLEPPSSTARYADTRLFHVEHGQVQPLI